LLPRVGHMAHTAIQPTNTPGTHARTLTSSLLLSTHRPWRQAKRQCGGQRSRAPGRDDHSTAAKLAEYIDSPSSAE
jgi:hypothetical protein